MVYNTLHELILEVIPSQNITWTLIWLSALADLWILEVQEWFTWNSAFEHVWAFLCMCTKAEFQMPIALCSTKDSRRQPHTFLCLGLDERVCECKASARDKLHESLDTARCSTNVCTYLGRSTLSAWKWVGKHIQVATSNVCKMNCTVQEHNSGIQCKYV
jgi:hypothetical protein